MKTKLVRPVLVESKEPNNIYTLGGKLYQTTPNTNIVVSKTDKLIPQQLILISLEDEKIEVGDIGFINIGGGTVGTVSYDKEYKTWDLTTKDNVHYPFTTREYIKKVIVPQEQISPELIQQLVDEYHNGGMKDFEIEMIEKIHNHYSGANAQWKELLPKLTNGFVTIVTEKENSDREIIEHVLGKCQMTYTEEELLDKLFLFANTYPKYYLDKLRDCEGIPDRDVLIKEWFEQNKRSSYDSN